MTYYFVPKKVTWRDLIEISEDDPSDPKFSQSLFESFYRHSPKRIFNSFYHSYVPDYVIQEIFEGLGEVVRT